MLVSLSYTTRQEIYNIELCISITQQKTAAEVGNL